MWESQVSSPIISDGLLYATSAYSGGSQRTLSCFNASTGNEIWNYTGQSIGFCIANGRVYLGEAVGIPPVYLFYSGIISCLDASTGAKLWSHTYESHFYSTGLGTPIANGGIVYFSGYGYDMSTQTRLSSIHALNALTGDEVWSYPLQADTQFNSLLVANKTLYAVSAAYKDSNNSWTSAIYTFNAVTGQKIWSYRTNGYFGGLVLAGDNVCVYQNSDATRERGPGSVLALNELNGSLLWNYTTSDTVSGLAFAEGAIFGVTSFGNIYAVNSSNGSVIWNNKEYGSFGTAQVIDGYLYVSTGVGVSCRSIVTGDKLWDFQASDYATPSAVDPESSPTYPTFASGVVYFGWNGPQFFEKTIEHNFYALDASNGKVLWNYSLPYSIMSPPLVTNNTVFIGASFVTSESPDWQRFGYVLAFNSTITSTQVSEGFSQTVVLAIAVGAVIAVVFVVLLFYYRRKRKNPNNGR
jgi:outer membrane protein assembly factor BamB